MSKKHVRRQVLVPLTLTFVILVGSFLYASYQIRIHDYDMRLTSRHQRVQNVMLSLISSRTAMMTSVAEFIADQRRFQVAMENDNRELLVQHGTDLHQRLSHQQQITHFYFHTPDGRHFLRVYQPDNLSASPPRFTMLAAMERGEPVSGLELGSNGTFTLRLVYPWYVDQQLLGYIELGQEIDPILRELKDVTAIDFVVTLNKAFLERDSWEVGMQMLGRAADWNLLADAVVIDKTLALDSQSIAGLIADENLHRAHGVVTRVDGRTYRGRTFPLEDVAGHTVGEFILLDDLTDNVMAFRHYIVQIAVFSLLLSGGLFIFAFRVLGRVDRQLVESRQRLEAELENQARTAEKLEGEVVERRRAEEQLTRLNEHLEQRVAGRTSELQQLNEELAAGRQALEVAYKELQAKQATILQQDKMACIGQLAAGVAHDINNPIGFVAGNLEVLQNFWEKIIAYNNKLAELLEQCSSEDEAALAAVRSKYKIDYLLAELPEVMSECFEGIDRVNRIVLNLKGFSRIDETEAAAVDINQCLDSTIGIVNNEIRYKAEIKKDYGHLPLLYCYPQQLNQVFMNLLINAAQAIERWGEIIITTKADDDNLWVSIRDTGSGIPPDDLERIFEPFYTTKEIGVGTGLGLSIVAEIIKKHQGEISVSSQLEQGAEFTIRLPFQHTEDPHA